MASWTIPRIDFDDINRRLANGPAPPVTFWKLLIDRSASSRLFSAYCAVQNDWWLWVFRNERHEYIYISTIQLRNLRDSEVVCLDTYKPWFVHIHPNNHTSNEYINTWMAWMKQNSKRLDQIDVDHFFQLRRPWMAAGRNQWLTSSPSVQLLIRHRAGDELYNLPEIHIDLESSKFWWNMIENNLLTLPTPYSAESMLVGLLVPHLGFPGSLESGQHASPTIQRSNTLRLWLEGDVLDLSSQGCKPSWCGIPTSDQSINDCS